MTLTLLAVSLNEHPLSQPITAHFDHHGGTIGRADHNTMALPDPERQISRLQAEIVAGNVGFRIRNISAANPIVVAGRSLDHGEGTDLAHGDEVRIGGYLLLVDCRDQDNALEVTRGRALITGGLSPVPAAPTQVPTMPPMAPMPLAAAMPARAPAARPPAAPAPIVAGVNPFADLMGGIPGSGSGASGGAVADPFADMFAPAPARSSAPAAPAARPPAAAPPARPRNDDPFADLMAPPAGVAAGSAGFAPPPSAASSRLPDDFDIFAPSPKPEPSERDKPGASADPFADLMPGTQASSSIDIAFGLDAAAPDALAHFMANTPAAPSAGGSGVSVDPMQALFGGAPPAPAAAPAQADRLPAVNAAFVPPRAAKLEATIVQAPAAPVPVAPRPAMPRPLAAPAPAPALTPPVAAQPAAAPPVAVDPADARRLWAALCQGAGIDLPLPAGGAEQQMRDTGRILRSAVDGVLQLMAVRANTRHELRANVTVIQAQRNNPLKFSPDARTGLEHLLQPPLRGFIDGPTAIDDAMRDLVGHSIGTVAGMRAAIDGMLDRFAPQALEDRLSAKSLLDNLVPMNRKAKLWDLYRQHNEAIRAEAQEDFDSLFGKAFLEAYELQIDKLRSNGGA